MPVFTRQQYGGVFIRLELHVSLRIAGRLRQRLPFLIEQGNIYTLLRSAVFQALGKDIQLIVVTVCGYANIAERK
ncbi:hypothetical protein D3C73_1137900 [compost metagenome]